MAPIQGLKILWFCFRSLLLGEGMSWFFMFSDVNADFSDVTPFFRRQAPFFRRQRHKVRLSKRSGHTNKEKRPDKSGRLFIVTYFVDIGRLLRIVRW